jgi:hypothetical protein
MHPGVARDLAPGHEPLVQLLEVVDPRSLSLYNETVPYEAIESFLLASALGPVGLGMDDVDPEHAGGAPQRGGDKRCSSIQVQTLWNSPAQDRRQEGELGGAGGLGEAPHAVHQQPGPVIDEEHQLGPP